MPKTAPGPDVVAFGVNEPEDQAVPEPPCAPVPSSIAAPWPLISDSSQAQPIIDVEKPPVAPERVIVTVVAPPAQSPSDQIAE